MHYCEFCGNYYCPSCFNIGDDLCEGCRKEVAFSLECGCGSEQHVSAFQHCSRCHELSREQLQELPSYAKLGIGGGRLMMQCCACRVVCCYNCDPNPDADAVAGVAASEAWQGPFAHPQLAQYVDCTFCCSRPEACSGLADFLKLAHELEGEHTSDDEESEGEGADLSDSGGGAKILLR